MINGQLLAVAEGLGVDSVALLTGYYQQGIRPDLIIHSDVGAEREATEAYLPVLNTWCRKVGFPEVTVVRYRAKNFKHWPAYFTIEENILTNVALPSIAYGGHSCSSKWKIAPQDEFFESWAPAIASWAEGKKILRAVGFEDSPHEHKRAKRCATFAVQDMDAGRYEAIFPLQTWGWNRERCKEEIASVGLPVPSKSSCFFCTAMKPWEVDELTREKLMRIVIIEARTRDRHMDYADKRRAELAAAIDNPELSLTERAEAATKLKRTPPPGQPLTEGIWRKRVKGMRGAVAKPGSMTEYIRDKGLLPAALVDALVRLTPTRYVTREDFEREGVLNWQDWLQRLCAKAETEAAQAA